MNIKIQRITNNNYSKFTKLIEYRRTNKQNKDLSYYDNSNMKHFMEDYKVLDSNTFFIYAAEMNNEFIGYINVCLIPKPDPRKGLLFVDELWTMPEYRRYGVASLLMDEVFKLAKKLDLWKVRLYVGEDNIGGRSFYHKMGYKENGKCLTCEVDVKDIK